MAKALSPVGAALSFILGYFLIDLWKGALLLLQNSGILLLVVGGIFIFFLIKRPQVDLVWASPTAFATGIAIRSQSGAP